MRISESKQEKNKKVIKMITTIIKQIELQNFTSLYVTLLALGAASLTSFILPRIGYEWCALRRLPAMDVVDEAIRICAEKGRPFYQFFGNVTFMGKFSIYSESNVSLARYITKEGAKLGVRYISAVADGIMQLLLLDFTRQGYIEAGRPEMFNPNDIRYIVAGSDQPMLEAIDTIKRERPGALVAMGHIGCGTPINIFQTATNYGTFVIGASESPDELSQAAMTADYTMTNEEQVVVGAYIDDDKEKMAAFIGEDIVKLIFITIMIIGGILYMTGNKIFG